MVSIGLIKSKKTSKGKILPEKQMIFRLVPMLEASTYPLMLGAFRDSMLLDSTAGGVIAMGAIFACFEVGKFKRS